MLILFRVGSSHTINPRQQSDVNWFTNTIRVCKGRAWGNLSTWNPTERQGDNKWSMTILRMPPALIVGEIKRS